MSRNSNPQQARTFRLQKFVVFFLVSLFGAFNVQVAAQSQPNEATQTKTKSPEEIEADNLSREVVKMFANKNFNDALPRAKRALELREKSVGAENPATLAALNNLAAIYTELGKHDEAFSVYQKLLHGQEKLFGLNDVRLSDTLAKMGWSRVYSNSEGTAESLFKRNLQIRENTHGKEDRKILPALNNLASFFQRTGRFDQAISFYRRMIAIHETQPNKQEKDLAEVLVKCALNLRLTEKKENKLEADTLENRARTIYAALNPTNKKIESSSGVLTGTALIKVQPRYPSEAKSKRAQGAVRVSVLIDEAGIVTQAKAIEGDIELRNVSEEAAKKWRFKPTELEGVAVKVQGILTFNFVLQ